MTTPLGEGRGNPVLREKPLWAQVMIICLIAFIVTPLALWLANTDPGPRSANTAFVAVSSCPSQDLEVCSSTRTHVTPSDTSDYVSQKHGIDLFEPVRGYRALGVVYVADYHYCVVAFYADGEVQISLKLPGTGDQLVGRSYSNGSLAYVMAMSAQQVFDADNVRSRCVSE